MSSDFHAHPISIDHDLDGDRHSLDEDAQEHCRICRGEASPHQPLYYPCKCSGSIKFVHQECLKEWLAHSQKKYCELCKTSFRFTKLYDRHMPQTLPFPLFLRQLARHALATFLRYNRYLLVGLVWLCCLPWCIRQIWRGLFWLADGNWLDEQNIPSEQNTTLISGVPDDSAHPAFDMPQSFEMIKFVLPPMQLSLADITRAVLSQGLFGRLLQLVLTLLVPSSASNHADPAAHDSIAHRSPSLLSDAQILTDWTANPTINNLTIDVVEGQLICICLVTAFILVFLIREWVINQQPIHNMPDPDAQDNPLPPPPLVDLNDPPNLGHRHNPHHPQEANVDLVPHNQALRPIAIPRLRRALTEDNILNAIPDDGGERPTLRVRAASAISSPSTARADDSFEEDFLEISASEGSDSPTFRTPALSNSILVQSEVEIISGGDADVNEHRIIPSNSSDGAQSDDFADRSSFQRPERSLSSPTQGPGFPEPDESLEHLIGQAVIDQEQRENIGGPESERLHMSGTNAEDIDDVLDRSTSGTPGESATPPVHSSDAPPPREESALQKISAWLWHVDNQQRVAERPEALDVERIVQDLRDEAPFVPIHHQDRPGLRLPVVEAPAAPAREANNVFGLDLNDPNAVEDAEDIDGILELLGMEGPLFGMVQNVIFSLFLITLSLAASIWCPYIWGKIALLFMSNPLGMLVKAPLFAVSRAADIVVDVIFVATGMAAIILNTPFRLLQTSLASLFPGAGTLVDLDAIHDLTLDISRKSSTRLQKILFGAVLNLKPDLPTFSMLSHHALISMRTSVYDTVLWVAAGIVRTHRLVVTTPITAGSLLSGILALMKSIPGAFMAANHSLYTSLLKLYSFGIDFNLDSSTSPAPIDDSLVAWSTADRIATIVIGYAFFAAAGVTFLELAHLFMGLRNGEKVEGYFADCLRQAGGVMKVIVIIGIEMLLFPLYCGLLLDIALLPLFANATLISRISFLMRAPFTGIFIHWFIGTCYMFHFALFVGICRKVLRKGVLYFIRDPDDPTFHPVRDVLERPVPTQLGKIAFSALVYGGLVMMCLGGVVWSLEWVGGVFPIQWATSEPKLAFPIDVIFYNLMLPLILRKAEPSKRFTTMYEWWFRRCAELLRLSAFLFGDNREKEKSGRLWLNPFSRAGAHPTEPGSTQSGTFVRAPASDSVRIPRGQNVFLEVNEHNERIDGQPDPELGIHGKVDKRFVHVYLPPNFRSRITAFILLLWLYAASTGIAFTIGPLLLGRVMMRWLSKSDLPPNDLHAFTLGVHIFALAAFCVVFARPAWDHVKGKSQHLFSHHREALIQATGVVRYVAGLTYLATFTAVALPCILSTIIELYLYIPLFTYLASDRQLADTNFTPPSNGQNATIFILQTWTIGLLYLRLCLKVFLKYVAPESQAAIALRAIVRNGFWRPDTELASRAFVLPLTVVCFVLLAFPLACAKIAIGIFKVDNEAAQMKIYRVAYPTILGVCLVWYVVWILKQQISNWRTKIRDEVYLIGERLHNFHEGKPQLNLHRTEKEKYA